MNILSKLKYRFYSIKRQRKSKTWVEVKYKVQNRPSVSCKNSKCLDLATVQVKSILQKRPFLSNAKQNEKMNHT